MTRYQVTFIRIISPISGFQQKTITIGKGGCQSLDPATVNGVNGWLVSTKSGALKFVPASNVSEAGVKPATRGKAS